MWISGVFCRSVCLVASVGLGLATATAAEFEAGLGTSVYQDRPAGTRSTAFTEYRGDVGGTDWSGRFDQQWRFDESDVLWSGTAGRSLNSRWTVSGRVAGSTGRTDLFPRRVLELTPYFLVTDGWLTSVSLRETRYASDSSLTLIPGIEYYLGNYRLAYTAFIASVVRNRNTADATVDPLAFASSVKVDRYYRYSSHIGVGLSMGTERYVGNGDDLEETTPVGILIDGLHGWSPVWATGWQVQAVGGTRSGQRWGSRLGVMYRF